MAKKINEKCYVYLNGRVIGFVEDGEAFANEVRSNRRRGVISGEINVSYTKKQNEVHVNADHGRVRKPYIVVEDGKSKFTPDLETKLINKEIDFNYLVRNGVLEYLDADEEENCLVAMTPKDITSECTHLEVDPASFVGLTINVAPFPEYNLVSRQAMLANFIKQSEGLSTTNFNLRFDSRGYLMFYPQNPIVSTKVFRAANFATHPHGQNFIVSIASYYGYNMNDAIVINKASVERGLGRSVFYKTHSDEERRYPGGQKDHFRVPAATAEGYLGEHAYAKLSDDGIIEPETRVEEGDVMIGKVAPPRFLEESIGAAGLEEKTRDDSTVLKPGERGVVDDVIFTESTGATKVVKVRVRSLRIPEIGDKFASRHGQKGVIAYIVPQEDMPFTANGVIPDLILNPHAIPSRLTFGHLLEELGGKAAAVSAKEVDGTPFAADGNTRIKEYGEMLKAHGYNEFGEEYMYDGVTGKRFRTKTFIGIAYYERLYHMVSNKIQVRARGPVQILTHQPTEGKAREGGLRFGEMERDVLVGYGASLLIKERLLEQSDESSVLVCRECGSLGYIDYIKRAKVCPVCGNSSLTEVKMSYAFKLLLDEIKSMHIFPKIKLND